MKKNHQTRILLHDRGTGDLTQDDVEKRAREIAVIGGRAPEAVSEADRAEAWAELSGELLPGTSSSDQDATGSLSRDPSEPSVRSGTRSRDLGARRRRDPMRANDWPPKASRRRSMTRCSPPANGNNGINGVNAPQAWETENLIN
jgi:hypothetical protein